MARGRLGLPWRACAVRSAKPTTTRSSTRARPTTARRSGAGGSASPAGVGSPPTSASTSFPLMVVEALRSPGPVRRREGAGRDRAGGGRRARSTRPPSTRSRPRSRRRRAARGHEVTSEWVGPHRARAAPPARPGLGRPVRVGLQGLRRPRRLRARGRRAPEEHRAQGPRPLSERSGRPGTFAPRRNPCNHIGVVLWLSFAPPSSGSRAAQPQHIVVRRGPAGDPRREPNRGEEQLGMAIAPEQIGIGIGRYFTRPGTHPYDMVEWERRDARIHELQGRHRRVLPARRRVPRRLVAERHQHRRPEVLPRHARHARARDVAARRSSTASPTRSPRGACATATSSTSTRAPRSATSSSSSSSPSAPRSTRRSGSTSA